MTRRWSITFLVVAMILAAAPLSAAPPEDDGGATGDDYLESPLDSKRNELRQEALEKVVTGEIDAAPVVEVAKGQFVELEREEEESIWTVLGEFSDFPHNSIAEPDRTVDNTTIWTEDFSEEHYEELLFSDEPGAVSMRNFYIELSSNRYTVNGDVTDWVGVPDTAASYGNNEVQYGPDGVWRYVDDSVDGWWNGAMASGMSAEEANDYLSQFDVWDRYDHDGDGNFDEPDGYIDHFQSVHSGEGEEAGGGVLGADAIWSHRWYVQTTPIGAGGPTLDDGTVVPFGGTRIGDSKYWIGDYTIEPENGGVGVFAHEYAHDLGLPDLYDTAGGENGTGFWTLMSSGSWGGEGKEDIGSKPVHMGAWEKLQLGWLDYEVAFAGDRSVYKLGPSSATTKQAQALITVLPDKEVTTSIGDPYAGENFYYSGSGNDLDNLAYRTFDLPAGASLTAQVDYDIEVDWDYAYLVVSTDGGDNWEEVETSESTTTNPNGQNFGFGITGSSGGWTELTADLSAYTGEVLLGFRYWTDGAAIERGINIDEVSVTGHDTDGAESDTGWTFDPADGFRVTTGTETTQAFNAYIAAYRNYRGYDDVLRVGPYNFGFPDTPNWVEHFPYQDGLLISYWDSSQIDNNTSQHPGQGLILPIDAHPEALIRADGEPWRSRIQSYDATFGLDSTDEITLHWENEPSDHGGLPAVSVFDDTNQYYNPDIPGHGVINPNTGTQMLIRSISARGTFMQVEVR